MNLKPFNIEDMPHCRGARMYTKTKNQWILEEFIKSEMKCCEIEHFPHKDANVCALSIKRSAKKFGYHQIIVTRRGDRVFLILEDEK